MTQRYTAKRLPRHNGVAGWNAILPPRTPGARLEQDVAADVVVIGGGFTGLSAARRLRQIDENLRIVLLEAGTFAESAAGRNSGFMIDLPHDIAADNYAGGVEADKHSIALSRKAIAFGLNAGEEYSMPQEFIDPCGKINAAATPGGDQHNRDYQKHLATLGEPSTLMSQQEMQDLTGSPHYTSGLFAPGTVMLQPAGYIRSLADGLRETVELYENSPVIGFSRQGTTWKIGTPKASVTCRQIILATNGHAESFGFFRRRLMHIFLYASISAQMTLDQIKRLGGASKWGVTPADPMGTSVRRVTGISGDRILIRNAGSFNPSMETSAGALKRAARTHARKYAERFPHLLDLQMEHRWAGHLCLSRNSVPAFGEVDEGVFAACCQQGLGTSKGTLAGMGAAELATGQPSEIAEALLAQPEPEKLPPEPFATLGANAYLKWKEWCAGKE
ncbi:MAG: FAD-binding oxidoreductase [Rhodobacteraceae bacterium]|nr:FAD-binding oxidoreductase [Paracoccaceae bacterium]